MCFGKPSDISYLSFHIYKIVSRAQGWDARAPGSWGRRQTSFSHSPLTKSKAERRVVVKPEGSYFSEANAGRHRTSGSRSVSRVLKVLLGAHQENVGAMNGYKQVSSKGHVDHYLGVGHPGSCWLTAVPVV